ncbi:DUF4188 domain-containing protein [Nocardioides sp. KIGAM211]|uniref:DUF4188 domain-containing protein n=1 Tax=Nocardioides luti TaxID=2761101 RepID=A0A7X0REB1_9ACTN|nr:DUF4188 domain-containing protein [Nocardioides luti]MBB6626706.1 DUF4188 domain-containing protein [Nocardioides luti]
MGDVRQGRWGARIDGDFVVFLIGAQIDPRHPVRTLRDLGGMRGMPYMLQHLTEHPEKGLLHYETYGLTFNVQYWRSFEHLERFARDDSAPHVPAWRNYWRRVGSDPRSGIWHETFLVRDGEYEAVYANTEPRGLGRAGDLVSLREDSRARGRLKRLTTTDGPGDRAADRAD